MTRQEILAIAKPIPFNTEMVRAIQDNRKTVTRRVVKPQPKCYGENLERRHEPEPSDFFLSVEKNHLRCRRCGTDPQYSQEGVDTAHYWKPPYQKGDYLYVRETWRMQNYGYSTETHTYEGQKLEYRADFSDIENEMYGRRGGCAPCKWHPSTHMPKEAARLFLRVTDVRVERLQDMTEEQAIAEGIKNNAGITVIGCRWQFSEIWDSTIKKSELPRYGWNANPWVWTIEFERVNVDE